MTNRLLALTLTALLLGPVVVARQPLSRAETIAQGAVTLGVDADPTGNTATSVGTIERCTSVPINQSLSIDIFVRDVVDLLGWETYVVYDPSLLRVIDRNVEMFQAANANSNVFDASETLPDADGQYHLAAVDIGEPPSPDSGSGVLARLTLQAVAAGVSPASLALLDVNEDGTPDLGSSLTDAEGEHIADVNGDGLFDGPMSEAWIAVGTPCPETAPTPAASLPVAPQTAAAPVGGTPSAVLAPTGGAGSGGAGGILRGSGAPWVAPFIAGGILGLMAGALILSRTLRRKAR